MLIYIVCGCNSHYLKPWYNLYLSIKKYLPNAFIHFFDLELNFKEVSSIQKLDIIYHKFDFSKYDEWVNVELDAGQWAWKAQCIKEIMELYPIQDEKQYLAWFDSCNIVCSNLQIIFDFIEKNGIYTNTPYGNIIELTVTDTIQYLDAGSYIHRPMRNAALPVFNINIEWVRNLINEYSKFSLIKECIYPNGSSRLNHRQDQSVLSILYYKYKEKYNFEDSDFCGEILIHQM